MRIGGLPFAKQSAFHLRHGPHIGDRCSRILCPTGHRIMCCTGTLALGAPTCTHSQGWDTCKQPLHQAPTEHMLCSSNDGACSTHLLSRRQPLRPVCPPTFFLAQYGMWSQQALLVRDLGERAPDPRLEADAWHSEDDCPRTHGSIPFVQCTFCQAFASNEAVLQLIATSSFFTREKLMAYNW